MYKLRVISGEKRHKVTQTDHGHVCFTTLTEYPVGTWLWIFSVQVKMDPATTEQAMYLTESLNTPEPFITFTVTVVTAAFACAEHNSWKFPKAILSW